MTSRAVLELAREARELWQEAKELRLIFNSIIKSYQKETLDI